MIGVLRFLVLAPCVGTRIRAAAAKASDTCRRSGRSRWLWWSSVRVDRIAECFSGKVDHFAGGLEFLTGVGDGVQNVV